MTHLFNHPIGERVSELEVWGDAIVRELCADPTRFHGNDQVSATGEAMSWYAEARKRRESAQAINIGGAGTPTSRFHIERGNATFAAISGSMKPVDFADNLDAKYGTLAACVGSMLQARATEELIDRMCNYYIQGAEHSQQWLADKLHMSPRTLSRHMERLEAVMARRFRARGLIP